MISCLRAEEKRNQNHHELSASILKLIHPQKQHSCCAQTHLWPCYSLSVTCRSPVSEISSMLRHIRKLLPYKKLSCSSSAWALHAHLYSEGGKIHPPALPSLLLSTSIQHPSYLLLSCVRLPELIKLFWSQSFRSDLQCPSPLTSSLHWEEGLACSDWLSLSLPLYISLPLSLSVVLEEVFRSFTYVKVLKPHCKK